jgi:hypothetical protein
MIDLYIDYTARPDYGSPSWRAFMASAFWLRFGFVGASVVAIALVALFTGDTSPSIAAASAVSGLVVAAASWRRSWVILDRADATPSESCAVTGSIAFGNGMESATSR